MRFTKWNKRLFLFAASAVMVFSVGGCGNEKPEEKDHEIEAESEVLASHIEETMVSDADEEKEETPKEDHSEDVLEDAAKEEAYDDKELEQDKLLERYYEEVLLKEEGLLELPSGCELSIKERHMESYSIGEALLEKYGICYHAVWDYDKDEEDELLVLALDEDKEYDCSKIYARMYEVVDGEVVEAAELESFFNWMEFDTSQSTEILLRETKDWFYLAEEAAGFSSIYADGSCYAIRVAHYDGSDFVVDVAKQLRGSDFSDTNEEVTDTARLLTYVGFDNTAENLTYQYSFDRKDDLLSIFYMTGEIGGSLDKFYETHQITDVPPYMIRLFDKK